jgi:hypothetical protein
LYRVDGTSLSVAIERRRHLVRNVIDKWIGPVSVLLKIWHCDTGKGRDVLGLARHGDVRSDQVDVEARPLSRADVSGHR